MTLATVIFSGVITVGLPPLRPFILSRLPGRPGLPYARPMTMQPDVIVVELARTEESEVTRVQMSWFASRA